MVANGRDAERVAAREEGWGAMCDVIERRADLCGGWRRVRARARAPVAIGILGGVFTSGQATSSIEEST